MSADVRLLRWPDRARDDFDRLATSLGRISAVAAKTGRELAVIVPTAPEEPTDLDRARMLYAQRRARDAVAEADADLFADIAWDVLLVLFIANEEDHEIDVADVGGLVSVLPMTLARWLIILETRGLISRMERGAGDDVVILADRGLTFMLRCLSVV